MSSLTPLCPVLRLHPVGSIFEKVAPYFSSEMPRTYRRMTNCVEWSSGLMEEATEAVNHRASYRGAVAKHGVPKRL